jgi:hypothetical protein
MIRRQGIVVGQHVNIFVPPPFGPEGILYGIIPIRLQNNKKVKMNKN